MRLLILIRQKQRKKKEFEKKNQFIVLVNVFTKRFSKPFELISSVQQFKEIIVIN